MALKFCLRALLQVLAFLNEKFPHVRIETCSGGGGRFDAGMLFYSPQVKEIVLILGVKSPHFVACA